MRRSIFLQLGSAESTTYWLLPDLAEDLLLFLDGVDLLHPPKGADLLRISQKVLTCGVAKCPVCRCGLGHPAAPSAGDVGWGGCRLGGGGSSWASVRRPRRAGGSPFSTNHDPPSNDSSLVSLSLQQDPLWIKYWVKTIQTTPPINIDSQISPQNFRKNLKRS